MATLSSSAARPSSPHRRAVIAGSILFFGESTTTAGTWLFLGGSIELLIRPVIRLSRRVHLQRVRARTAPAETSGDF
ncbi:YrhK family protein [Rhodococcus sp. Eu-32]|uniref:YrhK family protein n=1 Tax=Rhodococcus sp. Eu-32 TaxID=1017319 RepID=UPI001FB1B198|nr:YrhK family protein [Rhodococcus sp. Eu-32]